MHWRSGRTAAAHRSDSMAYDPTRPVYITQSDPTNRSSPWKPAVRVPGGGDNLVAIGHSLVNDGTAARRVRWTLIQRPPGEAGGIFSVAQHSLLRGHAQITSLRQVLCSIHERLPSYVLISRDRVAFIAALILSPRQTGHRSLRPRPLGAGQRNPQARYVKHKQKS